MNRKSVDWKGYWVASTTPFTAEGALDETAFRELLRLYHKQGVHGVLINGTSGEWFSQSDAERRRVAEIAVEELKGKMTVVVGCTSFTASHTAELGRHLKEIGADGLLSTPPPYVAPTAREITAFFKEISDKVDMPIMVYNWARGVHTEITADIALELARIDRIVSLKDSTTNRMQQLRTLEAVGDKLVVFSGFVSRLGLAVLRGIGGDGNIDGGPLGTKFGVPYYEAVWAGDDAAALRLAASYETLMGPMLHSDWSAPYGAPQSQIKATMNMLGWPGGYPRPPLLPVDDAEALAALRRIVTDGGLMQKAAA